MALQTLSKMVLTTACGVILMGCGYMNNAVDKNPPTQRRQQCDSLKNQITLFQGGAGINTQSSKNPNQDADQMRLYDRYKCKDFETTK